MDKKIQNGVLAINRIRLFMEYDMLKTYSENLTILSEQGKPDNLQPFSIEKSGYVQGKPETLGPALEKQSDVFRSIAQSNAHDWLMLISLTSGILGMIPSPASPFLLGIAITADIADAWKYYGEGDKYTAGLLLSLSIIPGHQLWSQLKLARNFKKLGSDGVKRLVNKQKLGTITREEKKLLKLAIEELVSESDVLVKLTKEAVNQTLIKGLANKSLKFLVNFLYLLGTLGVGAGVLGLIIGGTYYLFDEIYLAVFAGNQKELDVRKYGKVQQLIALIKKDENYFKEALIHELEMNIEEASKKGIDLTSMSATTETVNSNVKKYIANLDKKKETEFLNIVTPPSFNMVLNKKINPTTKQPYTINRGHQGDVVKKLQNLLIKAGYEDMLSGFYSNKSEASDGIYGDDTKLTVEEFQKDNHISVDGVVGSNTLNFLINKTKEIQ